MTNSYVGFRAEIVSRIVKTDLCKTVEQFNDQYEAKMFDVYLNGKITIERKDSMLIARGEDDNRKKQNGGTVNFSLMVPVDSKDVERIVQIVNVLGNGRLIRERINTFTQGKSTLNQIPELEGLITAIDTIDAIMPGFIRGGWYYAPEANF